MGEPARMTAFPTEATAFPLGVVGGRGGVVMFVPFVAGVTPPVGLLSRNTFYNPYIARLSENE